MPDTDRRLVTRVAPDPHVRVDRDDYSLDPRLVGERVELRVSQRELLAVALRTGGLPGRHRRSFAAGLVFTDPSTRRSSSASADSDVAVAKPEVEVRPLERYDLIPA